MQFGPWDLAIQYLFPGVWIVPVVASVFGWIGAVQFWRKWGPRAVTWAQRHAPAVGDVLVSIVARAERLRPPPRPERVLRFVVAAPFFVVWLAGFVTWYLVGSIPNSAGIGDEGLDLAPTVLSVILGVYGVVAMSIATAFVAEEPDLGCAGPFTVSVIVALPVMAYTLLTVVLEFLSALLSLRLYVAWGGLVFILMVPLTFLIPVLAFQGGWAMVRAKKNT